MDSCSDVIPRFQESGVRHGRFHLSCTDMDSYLWLKTSVAGISIHVGEEGAEVYHLQLVSLDEVPKMLRAEVFISGPPVGVPKITSLLKWQNPDLFPDRWLLRHQQTTENSTLVVRSIDQETASALAAVDDRPHFGLGRVTFKVSRGSGQGGSGVQL